MVVAVPVIYLAVRAAQGNPETWSWVFSARLPGLMLKSFQLAVGTTVLAMAISLPLAWLVVRTDMPGRRWLTWILALPLVFPPYIGAFAYISIFGPRGSFEKLIAGITGIPGRDLNLPTIYSLSGAVIILGLFTFPYIYLIVASALRGVNQSLEDAALLQRAFAHAGVLEGHRADVAARRCRRAPCWSGSTRLSDFGAVAMLRVESFTSAIFLQLRGRFDRSAAAILSIVLVLITLFLLYIEERIQKQGAKYYQTSSQWKPAKPVPLGRWKWPAILFVWAVVLASVGAPAGMLVYWTVQGLESGRFSPEVLTYAYNSLVSAGGAAFVATALAFPLAYLGSRYASPVSRALYRFAYTGYALPGVVVALATIFFFHRFLDPLYGTVWTLIFAYVIRFMPQSLGATHAGLGALSPSLEDAGRSLGYSSFGVMRMITFPLVAPSLITGWALIFLNVLKELPATLLLRPAGWDTLAVRVWIEAEDGYYAQAAPSALLLVLLASIPMALLLRKILAGQARLS